jgi:hypothetical protein
MREQVHDCNPPTDGINPHAFIWLRDGTSRRVSSLDFEPGWQSDGLVLVRAEATIT